MGLNEEFEGEEELRGDIAEELSQQPKHRKLAFALLSAVRMAAMRHLSDSWEPIVMEVGRQFIKILEEAEREEIQELEDALRMAREYGLIGDFDVENGHAELEDVLETLGWQERSEEGKDVCAVIKGVILEGLRREGLEVVKLEEDVHDSSVTFRWETR
jgi:predicted hydrocarbon binding protein